MIVRLVWIGIVVALAHVAGSYGVELIDALNNYGQTVPVMERLAAPVRAVPWLWSETAQAARRGSGPPFEVKVLWFGYLVPFAATPVIALFAAFARRRFRRDDRRGFTPTSVPPDGPVGSGRPLT